MSILLHLRGQMGIKGARSSLTPPPLRVKGQRWPFCVSAVNQLKCFWVRQMKHPALPSLKYSRFI